MKSEIRKDYIHDRYVIIAPRRGKRPHDIERPQVVSRGKHSCVFCPKNLAQAGTIVMTVPSSVPKRPWDIAVIKNKFPSVTLDNPSAYGTQEVVVETPNHLAEIEELSADHVAAVFRVYAERTAALQQNKKLEYVLVFKNSGGSAGASLNHAHSQIFATQFVPPRILDKSKRVRAYRKQHGTCPYCDVITKEQKGPRLIWQDKHIIVFCPWAPMHNYETWIMPKRHLDNITEISEAERKSLATALIKILRKIKKLGLPYNYYFHQVVDDADQHLYLKITPRGSVWAGVEISTGLIINPVSPEEAARYFKQR